MLQPVMIDPRRIEEEQHDQRDLGHHMQGAFGGGLGDQPAEVQRHAETQEYHRCGQDRRGQPLGHRREEDQESGDQEVGGHGWQALMAWSGGQPDPMRVPSFHTARRPSVARWMKSARAPGRRWPKSPAPISSAGIEVAMASA